MRPWDPGTGPFLAGSLPPGPCHWATHRNHLVLQVCSARQAEAQARPLLLVQDSDADGVQLLWKEIHRGKTIFL